MSMEPKAAESLNRLNMPSPSPSAFPGSEMLAPVFTSIGLEKLAYHWHVLLFAAIACNFTITFSRFVSPVLFPNSYKHLSDSRRVNWDIHVVSLTHSMLIVALAAPLLWDEALIRDKVFGYDTYAGNVYAIACGYFLWDALISLYYIKQFGPGFVLHGACCFGVYLFAFRPFLNYYGCVFLMFEISTPFLNIHWFMDKLNLTGSIFQLINGIMLLASFFFVRILFGIYMSFQTLLSVLEVIDRVPKFLCVIYGTANIALNCLNVYWFYKMIETVVRRFDKTPAPSEKAGVQGKEQKAE